MIVDEFRRQKIELAFQNLFVLDVSFNDLFEKDYIFQNYNLSIIFLIFVLILFNNQLFFFDYFVNLFFVYNDILLNDFWNSIFTSYLDNELDNILFKSIKERIVQFIFRLSLQLVVTSSSLFLVMYLFGFNVSQYSLGVGLSLDLEIVIRMF